MQRRHGSEGIAAEETVQRRPVGLPELLAVLDHHAAQLRRPPVLHQALLRPRTRAARSGPPSSRSGRGRTSRRAGAAPRGNRSRWRDSTYAHGAVRERGTRSSATRSASSPTRGSAPGVPNARCSRSVGVVPPPMQLVDADRDSRPGPAARAPRDRRWASGTWRRRPTSAARTSPTSRFRERGTSTQSANGAVAAVGDDHRRLEPQPAADERRREAGGEHRARRRADGGRPAHSAASLTGRQADT